MFLGFDPKCIEPRSEVMNLILNRLRRNGIILLMGCEWWGLGRGLPYFSSFYIFPLMHGLISPQIFLIQRLIPGVIHPFRSWYTWLVFLHYYCFDWVHQNLIACQGHLGFLAYSIYEEWVLEIHFSVLVVEDSILYDLLYIKRDVLNNGIIQKSTFCSHSAQIFLGIRRGVMK